MMAKSALASSVMKVDKYGFSYFYCYAVLCGNFQALGYLCGVNSNSVSYCRFLRIIATNNSLLLVSYVFCERSDNSIYCVRPQEPSG